MDDKEKSYLEEQKNKGIKPNQETREDEPEDGEIIDGDETGKNNVAAPASHPLEHSWTFWYDSPSAKAKAEVWGTSMRPIYTFSTVEEFWGLCNNILHPSKLAVQADFYCFNHKIVPKWEDPVCANGGKWTITCPRAKTDKLWLYTLLAMIGEQFDHGDEICGAVVNVRRQDKISLWTKNASNEAAQMSIGMQWKKFLDCRDSIGFIFHDDAKMQERGAARSRYTC